MNPISALKFSRQRLLNAGFACLPRDVNGQPPSPEYESFLKLSQVRRVGSLAGYMEGLWLGRTLQLLSLGESTGFMALEANRWVLDIRENYPVASPEVLSALMNGDAVSRSKVWTLDFVLTLRPKHPFGPLRYVGLSCKPKERILSPSERRRARREADACSRLGWAWGYMEPTREIHRTNLLNLRAWAKADSLDAGCKDARKLAAALYLTTSNKPLASLLPMLCKRWGISLERPYFLLACAYYLGFIDLDHQYPIGERHPLPLVALS